MKKAPPPPERGVDDLVVEDPDRAQLFPTIQVSWNVISDNLESIKQAITDPSRASETFSPAARNIELESPRESNIFYVNEHRQGLKARERAPSMAKGQTSLSLDKSPSLGGPRELHGLGQKPAAWDESPRSDLSSPRGDEKLSSLDNYY